jgi:hypothetical protein
MGADLLSWYFPSAKIDLKPAGIEQGGHKMLEVALSSKSNPAGLCPMFYDRGARRRFNEGFSQSAEMQTLPDCWKGGSRQALHVGHQRS